MRARRYACLHPCPSLLSMSPCQKHEMPMANASVRAMHVATMKAQMQQAVLHHAAARLLHPTATVSCLSLLSRRPPRPRQTVVFHYYMKTPVVAFLSVYPRNRIYGAQKRERDGGV